MIFTNILIDELEKDFARYVISLCIPSEKKATDIFSYK